MQPNRTMAGAGSALTGLGLGGGLPALQTPLGAPSLGGGNTFSAPSSMIGGLGSSLGIAGSALAGGAAAAAGGGGASPGPMIQPPRQLDQDESLRLHKTLMSESRQFERAFMVSLYTPGNQTSIKVLKAMATSLKNRLDIARAALTPGAEDLSIQKMFPSFISNPYVSWASLVVMIEQLDNEVQKVLNELAAQETSGGIHGLMRGVGTDKQETSGGIHGLMRGVVDTNDNSKEGDKGVMDANDNKEGDGGAATSSSSSNSVPLKKRKRLHVEERSTEDDSANSTKEGSGADGGTGAAMNGVDDSGAAAAATTAAAKAKAAGADDADLLAQIQRNKMLQAAATNPMLSMESLGIGRAAGMDMTTAAAVMGHHHHMNPYFAARLAAAGLGGGGPSPDSAAGVASNPSAAAALAAVAGARGGIPPELKQQGLMSGIGGASAGAGGSDLNNMSMVLAAEAEKKRYAAASSSASEMQLPKMPSSAAAGHTPPPVPSASAPTSAPKSTKQSSNTKKATPSSDSQQQQQTKTPSGVTSSSASSSSSDANLRLLPVDFCPTINEVVIGRGKKVTNHCGNVRFRELIYSEIREYSEAMTKAAKSSIIVRVLQKVKNGSPETGGFVKQDLKSERWFAVEDALARITTAQAFRDALSSNYKSSKQFKQQSRWDQKSTTSPPSSNPGGGPPSSSSFPRPL